MDLAITEFCFEKKKRKIRLSLSFFALGKRKVLNKIRYHDSFQSISLQINCVQNGYKPCCSFVNILLASQLSRTLAWFWRCQCSAF